jgi:acyl dehydratase
MVAGVGAQAVAGRYLEDFESGLSVVTAGRAISDADLQAFALLTGDSSDLHMNDEYARSTPYGQRIVHGALVFSISVGLTTQSGLLNGTLLAFSRLEHLRFVRPVFVGDTVTVAKRVLDVEITGADRGLLVFDTRVRNQRGEIVVAYVDKLLVARRVTSVPAAVRAYSTDLVQ